MVSVSSIKANADYRISSPDGQIKAAVSTNNQLQYSISKNGVILLNGCRIGMTINTDLELGRKPEVVKVSRSSEDKIYPVVAEKNGVIDDVYNRLKGRIQPAK